MRPLKPNASLLQHRRFPAGFLWGPPPPPTRSRARRRGWPRTSIWDTFSHTPGRRRRRHRRRGVRLLSPRRVRPRLRARWRCAFRFSVAWPRIQPSGSGAVNQRGIDFYRTLTDLLARRDHAHDHAVPLGSAAGARGHGRLEPRTRRALRGVRGDRGVGAGRPGRDLDDDQRTPSRRAPGIPHRHACPGSLRRRARRGGDPPPLVGHGLALRRATRHAARWREGG